MNINFENDLRHNISDKMLRNLKKVSYKQDDFGMDKYQEPLHPSYNYNWISMTIEELSDALKYLQCEMDRKSDVIKLLKAATHQESVGELKEYIKTVLEILELDGTGKE
ncbi:hypothetical protein PZE06_05530 [Robertmurraya sp. DFI.2.37]|uniref:hypothetical protein n=1 Tax=Robertmurraya sp. DFI.2.37 TaxID=3031819 RepID=UPI001248B593|nr:hypothetical protein [Robertmurraya sp. DFI.2.37]MDF1507642.1 hypothetical protein [Robertmurraya sp. DFI.2.37]